MSIYDERRYFFIQRVNNYGQVIYDLKPGVKLDDIPAFVINEFCPCNDCGDILKYDKINPNGLCAECEGDYDDF